MKFDITNLIEWATRRLQKERPGRAKHVLSVDVTQSFDGQSVKVSACYLDLKNKREDAVWELPKVKFIKELG